MINFKTILLIISSFILGIFFTLETTTVSYGFKKLYNGEYVFEIEFEKGWCE